MEGKLHFDVAPRPGSRVDPWNARLPSDPPRFATTLRNTFANDIYSVDYVIENDLDIENFQYNHNFKSDDISSMIFICWYEGNE